LCHEKLRENMSSRIRSSKVRHVYCDEPKQEFTYSGFTLDTTMGDHPFISCSTKFFAVSLRGGGGPVLVWNFGKYGNVNKGGVKPGLLNGHKDAVLDTAFNPFHPNVLATGSLDASICIWGIPEGGLKESSRDPLVKLKGHSKKVTFTEFHPTSNNVLGTVSADKTVRLWDIEKASAVSVIKGKHGNQIQDLKWNYDGSLAFTSCKDKYCRLFDPRAPDAAQKFKAHLSVRAAKGCFLNVWNKMVTCGFDKSARRECKFWDARKPGKPITNVSLGQGSGVILPYFDRATKLLYLAGRGDGNIKILELVKDSPHQYMATNFMTKVSATGICPAPKSAVDVLSCETTRLLKLSKENGVGRVAELKFVIPRKDECFQEDLFPDDIAGKPAQSADDYFDGNDVAPILMKMDPDERDDSAAPAALKKPKKVKSRADIEAELRAAKKEILKLEKDIKELKQQLAA